MTNVLCEPIDGVGESLLHHHRISDLASRLENIDGFQVLEQRQIKPLAIVEGKTPLAPSLQLLWVKDAPGESFWMNRRGNRYESRNSRLFGSKQQSDRAAHAGAEDADFSGITIAHERTCRAQVLDFAAVSDVCKFLAGLAGVCKIEPEG